MPFLKIFFSLSLLLVLSTANSFSDTLIFEDGEEKRCVILEETSEEFRVMTLEGERVFRKSDIESVIREDQMDNLLLLAGINKKRGQVQRAYYLYQRALQRDPENETAIRNLKEMESDFRYSSSEKWVAAFQRFSGEELEEKDDSRVLLENAAVTEELFQKKGIVLFSESGRVKVSFISDNSPFREHGIWENDTVVSVNSSSVDYLGLYDVADLIVEKSKAGKITFERTIWVWRESYETTMAREKLIDIAGFRLSEEDGKCMVEELRSDSSFARRGMREGDRIVKIGGKEISSPLCNDSVKDILMALDGTVSQVDVVFRRSFEM